MWQTRRREEIVRFSRKLRNSSIAGIADLDRGFRGALFLPFLLQDIRIAGPFALQPRISSRDYVSLLRSVDLFNEVPVDTFHEGIESSESSLRLPDTLSARYGRSREIMAGRIRKSSSRR